MTKQPDWEAIERAFRAGALSIRTIADGKKVSGARDPEDYQRVGAAANTLLSCGQASL